jgi:hypothetical protein
MQSNFHVVVALFKIDLCCALEIKMGRQKRRRQRQTPPFQFPGSLAVESFNETLFWETVESLLFFSPSPSCADYHARRMPGGANFQRTNIKGRSRARTVLALVVLYTANLSALLAS